MKVLLTLYGDETAFVNATPEDIAREMAAWQAYDEAAREAGVLIACDGLEGTHTATTLRRRDGQRHVTDGPFIETKEVLGGIFVIEARDLDHALSLAKMTPIVHGGVEVRPLLGLEVLEDG